MPTTVHFFIQTANWRPEGTSAPPRGTSVNVLYLNETPTSATSRGIKKPGEAAGIDKEGYVFKAEFSKDLSSVIKRLSSNTNTFSVSIDGVSQTASYLIVNEQDVYENKSLTATTSAPGPAPEVPATGSGGAGAGSGAGGGRGSSGGGGGTASTSGGTSSEKTKAQETDTPIAKDNLNLQAEALQKVYDAAKSIKAPDGAGEDLRRSIQTMISVRNNEFQDSLTPGATWTSAHSRILRLAAKKLLEDVSNPELQQFVQSYDAAMSGGDILTETDSLGITRRGITALSSFVSANMDTQPQKGLAQLILKKANVGDGVLSPRGSTMLASAWALIFSLHSEFVRIKTLNAIGSSPVMRYPVPSREESDRNDEPSVPANVKANLTLKVWSQADRDGFFDVGPDSIVVIFKPADESFAKSVAQLPVGTGFASLLRTARGTREELINADRKKRGGQE